ncbi:MAG: DNA recombination protein RmuC [Zetaproteobacteria bacterium]|nr:MAG: DNA recombination protein RmuC [Zetaproteobacteria bacterium]
MNAAPVWITLLTLAYLAAGWLCYQQRRQLRLLGSRLESSSKELTELRISLADKDARLEAALASQSEMKRLLEVASENLEAVRREKERLQARLAEMEGILQSERKAAKEQLRELERARQTLAAEFKQLAHDIFEQKTRSFSETSRKSLDQILDPIRQQLGEFRRRMDEIHRHEVDAQAALRQQLEHLQQLNQQMNEEARNLTRALKGDKKVQGDWGELVLESVLEQSGLRKGIEYTTQHSHRDREGRLKRPDVIIHLPDGKHLIIDAKVSLVDYNAYVAAENEADRRAALERHVKAVGQHIEQLSRKDYAALTGLKAPDFVFLFMPIEAAFMVAFQHDPSLFSKAFERNIVVVTPTTLLATLKTVEYLWRNERQNENARRIADRAGALYDKLRGFVEDFERLGVQLATAQKSYDSARNKLVSGRGNVIRQAEHFVELGVKVRRRLPAGIREEAGMDALQQEDAKQSSNDTSQAEDDL